jgi:hypothetical protein
MDQVLGVVCGRMAVERRDAVLHHLLAWLDLPAEGRDLDDFLAELDMGQPKSAADDPAVPEQLLDLIRMRGRADVEVLGSAAEQEVAHAAADQVSNVVRLTQPIQNFEGVRVDVTARERVLRARDDPRFHHCWHCTKTTPNGI